MLHPLVFLCGALAPEEGLYPAAGPLHYVLERCVFLRCASPPQRVARSPDVGDSALADGAEEHRAAADVFIAIGDREAENTAAGERTCRGVGGQWGVRVAWAV